MFIKGDTLLPELPEAKLFRIMDSFAKHPQTYRDIESRLKAMGIAFSDWRNSVFQLSDFILEGYWTDYVAQTVAAFGSDDGLMPSFSAQAGNGVVPGDVFMRHGDPAGIFGTSSSYKFEASDFDLPEGGFSSDFEEAQYKFGLINPALTRWVVGGMFQLEICLTVLNCFNLDARGRPKKA